MLAGERRVLIAIAEHLVEFGWPPSIADLCAALGLASTQTVHGRLVSLERQGLIVRGRGPRQLRLTGPLDVTELAAHAWARWDP